MVKIGPIHVSIFCGRQKRSRPKIRVVPKFGVVSELTTKPTPTPERFGVARSRIIAVVQITATQQVPISVKFEDRFGNPAQVDGVPQWLTDNTDVLSLAPADDGLSCVVSAVGPIGSATVTLRADGKLGEEVREIIGTIEVQVTQGEAMRVELEAGQVAERPDPAPEPTLEG